MSQTLDQIYIANPSTTVLSTDLFYLVHSPFTPGTDSAITGANLKASLFTAPLAGALGGTGIVNTGLTISLASGASGFVLTSDVSGNAAWHAPAAGGITTIDGDSGSVTGSIISILAGTSTLNSGSSVSFVNSGTTSTLNLTDSNGNIALGKNAGNAALPSEASSTTILGTGAGAAITEANSNVIIGYNAMPSVTFVNQTVAIGGYALFGSTSSTGNTAVGNDVAAGLLTGQFNSYFGATAGSAHSGAETSNIMINSAGVSGESNTLRIGTGNGTGAFQLTSAYIYGINTNSMAGYYVTIDPTSSQLGYQLASVPGISSIAGDTGTITGSAVTIYADNATNNAGSSVLFKNSGTISLLSLTDANDNTHLGQGAGNLGVTAGGNTALGVNSLATNITGGYDTAIGFYALNAVNGGGANVAVGALTLQILTTGSSNIAIGQAAGNALTTGSGNTYLGGQAGQANVLNDSYNVYINTPGSTPESNTLRIGSATGTGTYNLTKSFISGINGNTSSNPVMVTINTSTDQLGTFPMPAVAPSTTYVITSPYSVLPTDDIILCDTSLFASPMSVVLLAITTPPPTDGQAWTIKDWSGAAASFPITITVAGGTNIDGATSVVLNQAYQAVSIAWSALEATYSVVYNYATASGGSGITTILGDSGSITGSSVTLFANQATLNCGSSVAFVNSGSTATLNLTDANSNIIMGKGAGNASTAGSSTVAIGALACAALTSGEENVAMGGLSLQAGLGVSGNIAVGYQSLYKLTSGGNNIALSKGAGSAYTSSETSNILFNSLGVIGESNVLRIGDRTGGAGGGPNGLLTAYICGINGNTLSGTPLAVTIDSTTNQLGVAAFPSGGSVTIDGDTGSITGSTLTVYANVASLNCGSTVSFVNSGSTSTLNVTDSNTNIIIGLTSGNNAITGTFNVGLGVSTLSALTAGVGNIGIGNNALVSCTGDTYLVGIGTNALAACNGGVNLVAIGGNALRHSVIDIDNTAIGFSALAALHGGSSNTVLGANAALDMLTGSYNLILGALAGGSYSGAETSNTLLNNTGVLGESNTLHIGSGTGTGPQQLSAAFISGINGITSSNALMVTINSVTDQLGVQAIPSGGSVTIAGDTGSISGSSLTIYADTTANNCGSSVSFVNSGTTSTLNVTDSASNTVIGLGSGNSSFASSSALNTVLGYQCMPVGTSTAACVAIGYQALNAFQNGSQTTAIGYKSLVLVTTGQENTAIGSGSGQHLTTGNSNLYFGINCGTNHTSNESSNLLLNSAGVTGESSTLRVGNGTGTGADQLAAAFISGINGNTVSNTLMVTINSSTDQLGVQAIPTGGLVPWTDQPFAFAAVVNNGYFCTGADLVTMPASPTQGQVIYIAADSAGAVVVLANTGQTIRIGANVSSSGGTATNTSIGDSLQLVFRAVNSEWFSVATEGNWNVA